MLRKSQSQIFGYVFILVVAALVLLFGYRALIGVGEQTEISRFTEFKARLNSDVASVAVQFGSLKRVSYDIPGFVSEICFYAPSSISGSVDESCQSLTAYPLVKDSVDDKSGKNVFILGELPEALYIPYIDTGVCPLRCFDVSRGKVEMLLENKDNKTLIST